MSSKQERRQQESLERGNRRGRRKERPAEEPLDSARKHRARSKRSSRDRSHRSSYSRRRAHRPRDRSSSLSGDDRRKRRRTTIRRRSRSSSQSRSRSRPRSRSRSRSRQRHLYRRSHEENGGGRSRSPPLAPPRDPYHYQHQQMQMQAGEELDRDQRRHVEHHRRSYSVDRPRHRRQRKKKRHHRHPRRSRSHSPSSSSSSSSASSRMPPRPQAVPRAGVVSDDDEGMGTAHGFAYHGSGGGGGRVGTTAQEGGPSRRNNNNRRNNNINNNNKRKRESAKSSSQAHDDTIGHFWGGQGSLVGESYRVVRELGVGTFGRVVECMDLKTQQNKNTNRSPDNLVAIKIVRKVKRYYESALIEADIVSDVNRRGGPRGRGTSHFAVMYEAFNFRGHYCLVFESLGPSLYDYLKRNKYQPFPMHCIRDFSKQLLEAIEFIHSFRLIHTDLKPENILLTKCREISYGYQIIPEITKIKVIDFGGATYDDEKKSSVVNTRQYRAPEVILGTGWSMPSDLWSAGCIMAELYQGELLFATHDNLEHLGLMERIIGPFPPRMLQRARQQNSSLTNQAFDANGRHRMERVLQPENLSYVVNMPPLESIVRQKKDAWFLDLLRRILVIDPFARSSARDCLRATFG